MTSTERDLPEDKLREIIAKAQAELHTYERVGRLTSSELLSRSIEAADALASIRAERDAAVADVAEWFDACWKVSGTGMSKVRFLEKYRVHLGVSEEAAKRASRAIAGEPSP